MVLEAREVRERAGKPGKPGKRNARRALGKRNAGREMKGSTDC
jgi:hypothetical protein